MSHMIHIATVSSPHGVKGQFKLFCHLEDPSSIVRFKEFFNESGQLLKLQIISSKGKMPIAEMANVSDMNAAETLKQTKIFIKSTDFPDLSESEYYAYQLAGLKVVDSNNQVIGTVKQLLNFGAGDVLELDLFDGTTELYPFINELFPDVDLTAGSISFSPPNYI